MRAKRHKDLNVQREIGIVALAVVLPASVFIRFVLLSHWLDRLNPGLPPEQQFQLIGSWDLAENMRAWRRLREIPRCAK